MALVPIVLAAAVATATPPPKPAPVDCHDKAHRALDFWVGDWTVFDTRSNKPVAASRIESVLGGCAIKESYSQTVGPNGQPFSYQGTSYTALNGPDGQWKQFYVDSSGAAASYVGGPQGAAMVLTASGGGAINRMSYTPLADGSVRQAGEVSTDGGATWTTGYDFTYRR
jgi:hypothetical protein